MTADKSNRLSPARHTPIARWLLFQILLLSAVTALLGNQPRFTLQPGPVFPDSSSTVRLLKAAAISKDFEGNLYIVDTGQNQLLKFSPIGQLLKRIGGFGQSEEQFDDPRDVFAHTTLDVYIADYNNSRVIRFDKNLNYLNELVSRWPEPFNFDRVLSVAVSPQYDLFLLEDGSKKVIKFGRSSEPAEAFGGIYETFGQLLDPLQLEIQDSRHIFVSDPAQSAVVVFDYLGNYVRNLEHPRLSQPAGMHWGEDQRLYVLDRATSQIFVFSEHLKFVMTVAPPEGAKEVIDLAVAFDKSSGKGRLYLLSPQICRSFYWKSLK